MSGTQDGTEYRIRVPTNWNGALLVYAHGYKQPNTPDELLPTTYPAASPSLEDTLLSRGFALAASFYPNSDKEGAQQTLALTNLFNGKVGNPSRTIIWGTSMGGAIALQLLETYPGVYDGAIASCGPIGGYSRDMDAMLRFSVAYAAAFGWHTEAWGSIGDLRDNLNFNADVIPLIVANMPSNPATVPRWEFIRLVMGLPAESWWWGDGLTRTPGLGLTMWKSMERRAGLEAQCGGPVATNLGVVYALTDGEKGYLRSLGVNVDDLLAWMNKPENRFSALRPARNHLEHYGDLTGDVRRPVVTMHSMFDGSSLIFHENTYRALVDSAGKSDLLVQSFVNAPGHCSFSRDQFLSTVDALVYWLETGMRPGTSFFPETKGFNNSYAPPSWPY